MQLFGTVLLASVVVGGVNGNLPTITLREQAGNHGEVRMPVIAAGTGGCVTTFFLLMFSSLLTFDLPSQQLQS